MHPTATTHQPSSSTGLWPPRQMINFQAAQTEYRLSRKELAVRGESDWGRAGERRIRVAWQRPALLIRSACSLQCLLPVAPPLLRLRSAPSKPSLLAPRFSCFSCCSSLQLPSPPVLTCHTQARAPPPPPPPPAPAPAGPASHHPLE